MSTRVILLPESARFKSTVFPQLEQAADAAGARKYLAFNDSADQAALWAFTAPVGMTGTLTAVIHYAMASATSGAVILEATIEAISDNETMNTEGMGTVNTSGAITVPGTAGLLDIQSITLTNTDSIAVGDFVHFRIRRMAGTNGSDTAAGNLLLYAVEFQDAA
jgi:hypothetical protein